MSNIWGEEHSVKLESGDLSAAQDLLDEALLFYKRINSRLGMANVRFFLGNLKQKMGELKEAEKLFKGALSIYRQVNERIGEANSLGALGDVYYLQDQKSKALDSYKQAEQLYRKLNLPDELKRVEGRVASLAVIGSI